MTRRSRSQVGLVHPAFSSAHDRITAHERTCAERWAGMQAALRRIEETLDRLERRMWLLVYGVAGGATALLFSDVLRAALN